MSAEDAVSALVDEQNAIELQIFAESLRLLQPLYKKRREITRGIEKFWPSVIEASELLGEYITYEDTEIIDSLEDVFVEWDGENIKDFAITLAFGPNAAFEDTELRKQFWFNSARETYTSKLVPIAWKSGNDLTKHQPGRDTSFFNWFSYTGDDSADTEGSEIAQIITEELYPHALKFYQVSQQEDGIAEEYNVSDSDFEEGDDPEEEGSLGEGDL